MRNTATHNDGIARGRAGSRRPLTTALAFASALAVSVAITPQAYAQTIAPPAAAQIAPDTADDLDPTADPAGSEVDVGAIPAVAANVEGVHKVTTQTPSNAQSFKIARAYCPSNERVIGGGGSIVGATPRPTLSGLRPVRLYDGVRDAYVVTAVAPMPGTTANWRIEAYAMCAKPLPGLHIIYTSNLPSSSRAKQATAAKCPDGERVIGSGASLSVVTANIVLQIARPSKPGDIARAEAHEDADGYSGYWYVIAYAICAPPPQGYEVVFVPSEARRSETIKEAGRNQGCPGNKQLLSSGAAITDTAPGNVSLHGILPSAQFRRTYAVAVENTPTSLDWDFIVASSVCAS